MALGKGGHTSCQSGVLQVSIPAASPVLERWAYLLPAWCITGVHTCCE